MQATPHKSDLDNRPGHSEAADELDTLEKLSQRVWAAISDFRKRPNFDGNTGEVELGIHDSRQELLKGYKELAHHCYGRTVIGEKIDEERGTNGPFKVRITQANVSQPDCAIIGRNSPVATRLVSAQVGDEREINPDGTQYFKVRETRTLDGPTSLHFSGERPDFRLMTLRGDRLSGSIVVVGLRSFVESVSLVRPVEDVQPSLRPDSAAGQIWFEDWLSVNLSDSDSQSLSPKFFTRTTKSQEEALNKPRGLTVVEGIAGAGKTSVALGRLKFFSNFGTGEHKEHYDLESAPESDFSPAGMVGFVLSRSLKRYLQDTAIELGLERLPIRDFEEYRTHLSNRFGLTRSIRRNEAGVPACRTQLEWLRAVDLAIAYSVAAKLDEVVARNTEIPPPVRQAVQRFSLELKGTESYLQAPVFNLSGLAQRLVESVLQVEYRSRENAIHARSSRNEFRDRFDLEKELAQVRQEEERGVITPFVRQLLGLLAIEDLFVDAVHRGAFASRVRTAFGGVANTEINELIDEVRALFAPKKENERRTLTDADLLVLIVCAAMIADGFDYPNAPSHFHRVRRSTCVFIDEVQDFTEIEVFLMGMTASKEYHQITLSGDLCQRLQWSGSKMYDHLFPSVPRSSQNKSIFLDRNLRQRDPLARLSAGFRNVLQGDKRLDFIAGITPAGALALLHGECRGGAFNS